MANSVMPAARSAATRTLDPAALIALGKRLWDAQEAHRSGSRHKAPLSDRRLAKVFGITELQVNEALLAFDADCRANDSVPSPEASRPYFSVSLRRWVYRMPAQETTTRVTALAAVAA